MTCDIFLVHPIDDIFKVAVSTLLRTHHTKGKIKQACLDFWRQDYRSHISQKDGAGQTVCLVAYKSGILAGLSAAAISKEGKTFNSFTVVKNMLTYLGIGSSLVSTKTRVLKQLSVDYAYFANANNEPALKMLSKSHSISRTVENPGKTYHVYV